MYKAFQTLKDKGDPNNAVTNGPILCKDEKAWLHTGYYFWDEDIDVAHWWGKVHCQKKYIICKSKYIRDLNRCWDLYNCYEHRLEIRSIVKEIKRRNINKGKEVRVRDVINHLIDTGCMKYEAVRVAGTNSISEEGKFHDSIPLEIRNTRWGSVAHKLDLRPAIQICFYTKEALDRTGFNIVYPDKYINEEENVF